MRDRSSYTMQNLLLIHLTLWIFSELKYIKVCQNLVFLQCFSPILTSYVRDISTRDLEGWKTHLNSVKNYSQNNFTHTPKHHNLKPKSLKVLCSTVFFSCDQVWVSVWWDTYHSFAQLALQQAEHGFGSFYVQFSCSPLSLWFPLTVQRHACG